MYFQWYIHFVWGSLDKSASLLYFHIANISGFTSDVIVEGLNKWTAFGLYRCDHLISLKLNNYIMYNSHTGQSLCMLLNNSYPTQKYLKYSVFTLLCLTKLHRCTIMQSVSIFNFPFMPLLSNTATDSQPVCKLPFFITLTLTLESTSNSGSNSTFN